MKMPLFPLRLIAFPGEELHLHIFEPRYKQLISDVETKGQTFGICVYNGKLTGYGTEVRLKEIHRRYEDGRLDIKTLGLRSFRIKDFQNPLEGKLYSGGEVEFLENDEKIANVKHYEFIFYLKEMLYLLNVPSDIDQKNTNSFTFAHKVGLKIEEELELLKMLSENQRVDFLISYFKRMIPPIKALEEAKKKIRQNGHFKYMDPLDF